MTKITTTRIAHRVYKFELDGVTYHVDGQNHEEGSREWEVFIITEDGSQEWHDTYPTKKSALEDIEERHQRNQHKEWIK